MNISLRAIKSTLSNNNVVKFTSQMRQIERSEKFSEFSSKIS